MNRCDATTERLRKDAYGGEPHQRALRIRRVDRMWRNDNGRPDAWRSILLSRLTIVATHITKPGVIAVCFSFGTMSPTRVRGPSGYTRGEAVARTSRCVVRMRFPSRAIRCNSTPRVIRASRGKPSGVGGVLRAGVLVRDADRQLLAALLAAARQRCAAPLGLHSSTKSVRPEPPRVARAVCGLSHGYSRYGLDKTEV